MPALCRLIVRLGLARRHAYALPAGGFVAWHAAPLLGAVAFESADGEIVTRW